MTNINDVWVEKYRPKTIADCILPDRIKDIFISFTKTKQFPNLLLTGSAGTGKTTVAKALLLELDYDFITINASDQRNIDTVRHKIRNFASQVSLEGKSKAIILDEADGLNPSLAQPALRAVMEEFHRVRFILTCNFQNKLIQPLHSRTTTISFDIKQSEKQKGSLLFLKRLVEICELENIEADNKILFQVVEKFYPDNRRILNEIQRYGQSGAIDKGLLLSIDKTNVSELIQFCKDKDLLKCREWVVANSDMDPTELFDDIYKGFYPAISPDFVPEFIVLIGEYLYKSAFVANTEINMMAFLSRVLQTVEFK